MEKDEIFVELYSPSNFFNTNILQSQKCKFILADINGGLRRDFYIFYNIISLFLYRNSISNRSQCQVHEHKNIRLISNLLQSHTPCFSRRKSSTSMSFPCRDERLKNAFETSERNKKAFRTGARTIIYGRTRSDRLVPNAFFNRSS